ncbi:MAG: D-alanine--D-alanine ligase [Candidatus Tectomicrobia bacterium]|nr:D-alanine--D-alanine ligase [Candidatus Tectomicrobia bacterium]
MRHGSRATLAESRTSRRGKERRGRLEAAPRAPLRAGGCGAAGEPGDAKSPAGQEGKGLPVAPETQAAPHAEPAKLRVAVLFGGGPGEHEVSLGSAASVLAALDRQRYDVLPVGITRDGRWRLVAEPADLRSLDAAGLAAREVVLRPAGGSASLVCLGSPGEAGEMPIDVVFPVLHGTFGEDGTLQGMLEMSGVPYVGAGVLGSACGMDKLIMKALFAAAGLPQPAYVPVLARDWQRDHRAVIDRIEAALRYPLFVKPANAGSSIGVHKATTRCDLAAALQDAMRYDRRLVVEQGITGRELECGVLGNDEPAASVVGEIIPAGEFYDYQAKYGDRGSQVIIPANLPQEIAERVRGLAVAAFKAVDAAGMGRVDFFLEEPTQRVYVNEINTIPGFTAISAYPKLWAAAGLPYRRLLDRLIELARERHAARARLLTAFDEAVSPPS